MAKSGFQPYTYEQLYTTARDLTAAHNEQEAKLGALDAMAAGVEPYLDPEKHPEDQQMYDALQNYRKGLNDVTYHLASRGLSGHVYNNVMSLAADYSGKVKPIEGAVENYKKAHDMRVALMTQNPDYIPRYSWDDINVSENVNGASQRAVEGFKGTQYMNDITTTLQKLFNDFGLNKRNDIRIFGQQVYDYISKGMPAKTALAWLADRTGMSDEDKAKMMYGIDAVNRRYGIDRLQQTNPDVLSDLAGYQKQGIINAIGEHEMKTYKNLWDEAVVQYSTAKRIKGLEQPQIQEQPVLGGGLWTLPNRRDEKKNDDDVNMAIGIPNNFNSNSNVKPKAYGDAFYQVMRSKLKSVNPKYEKFADFSPSQISDINWWEKNIKGLDNNAQRAYRQAYDAAIRTKEYSMNKEPQKETITDPITITNFLTTFKNKLIPIDSDGSIDKTWYQTRKEVDFDKPQLMDIAFIPSCYNLYNKIETAGKTKNDYMFFKVLGEDGEMMQYALPMSELGIIPNNVLNKFREFDDGTYDYKHFINNFGSARENELRVTETVKDYIVNSYFKGRTEELKN